MIRAFQRVEVPAPCQTMSGTDLQAVLPEGAEVPREDTIKVVCRFRPLNDAEERAGEPRRKWTRHELPVLLTPPFLCLQGQSLWSNFLLDPTNSASQ